jgi:GNAT superfamily N-acetyltransferase
MYVLPTSLEFAHWRGAEIEAVLPDLAALRIAVFRDFPYLYEGTLKYETLYLQTYVRSPRALLFTVRDAGALVGATTCLPLSDETEEVQRPFRAAGYDIGRIVYFGESILLPNYRGSGLGHRFFDEREAHARSFGDTYRHTCFCGVVRPDDHPARPLGYRPLDDFWKKRGYELVPNLQSQFEWPDLGESRSTPKTMQYWMKTLQ